MTNIKNLALSILIFWFPFEKLVAQQVMGPCKSAAFNLKEQPVTATLYVNEYPLKKDQFYSDWSPGTIYFTNGKKASHIMLRYNGWKDALIWLRQSDFKTGQVIKGIVSSFEIETNASPITFIHYTDTSGFLKQDFFLRVIEQGHYSAYCYQKVTLIKGEDKFVFKPQYFLTINGGPLQRFNLRKGSFLSLFDNEMKNELKTLIRSNKLRLKSDHDLQEVIQKMNALNQTLQH